MDQPSAMAAPETGHSPYRTFTRDEWARLRADAPLTLGAEEVMQLQSLNDPISLDEVIAIYLPLTRLLSLYVAATQGLFRATQRFLLAENDGKVPYIIGLAGSVAVGKSTTARVLQQMLAHWPANPSVALVTTDGFLHPNAELARRGLMDRKGFPDSYDRRALLRFVMDVKSGRPEVTAPVYSHLVYDIVPDAQVVVQRPDILIVEGLNVLQPGRTRPDGTTGLAVSDFFDFSVYVDADPDDVRSWYVSRFLSLRDTAFRDPRSFFTRYAELTKEQAVHQAEHLWDTINGPNLHTNIRPTRGRATAILRKDSDHRVKYVRIRKV